MTSRAAAQDALVERVQALVGLGREDLGQVRARGRHAERVAVVGADLEDRAVLDDRHDLLAAADGADGHAAAQRLGQRDHVGHDAEALDGAARGDAQAGLDLVEDEHDAVLARDLAHGLEVARLGEHDPEVHHRRLHDHAGRLAALAVEVGDAAIQRLGVVEVHREDLVDDRLRDAGAVGQRGGRLARADLVVLDPDGDHHRVVVAVVGAEDLHHGVALGVGARDADRVHRRLRAGVRVAPAMDVPAARELLAHDDRVLGRARRSACRGRSARRSPCRWPGARGPGPSTRSRCGSRTSRCRRRPTRAARRRARGRSATARAAGRRRRRRR